MKKILSPIITLLTSAVLFGQQLDVSISSWKNNASGAYTLIHDDYGSTVVDGIWQYADTIASNRGIKFTAGAITSHCETLRDVNGYGDAYEYAKEVMIAEHGHEMINHTHTHDCAIGVGWSPCNGDRWADKEDFSLEIDQSTASIYENTGVYPRYFIFPFDQFADAANDHLKNIGYIGSRSGWTSNQKGSEQYHRNGYESFDKSDFYPDEEGFFRTSVLVGVTNGEATNLNKNAQNAIDHGVWVNRELHNVGNSGWGHVKVDDYRDHMIFLQEKISTGELWVGTVSEILTYQIQKLNYDVSAKIYEDEFYAKVFFNNTSEIELASYLDSLVYKSPISINVDLSSYGNLDDLEITQKGVIIEGFTEKEGLVTVNAYPHKGSLSLRHIGGIALSANKQTSIQLYGVNVYPNPSEDAFNIELGNNEVKLQEVRLFDSANRLVEKVDVSVLALGVGKNLPAGIYFLTLITDVGEVTKKIVKL